ncbi:site-specific DNA-methyltransferase [Agathobaculum sp.]|uniref:site-specific DNA-methyltransferase n=1 Tax=Agathobaculum sp. TaxID=2048138 RepID=UPI002A8317B0|nr:site-specific DNA-methyltransferase [Agathobaculum sp.]MDY3618471.1 site-specific DNA-methyltransferase [Agathobaculum sp.]
MPALEWIGKQKVINHHQQVPYRVLERQYSFDAAGQHDEDNGSSNMIIHGDNLEALKSLLPLYEGAVKCIYIDPPYNTGNEGWVYNDNVNDPKIKKWLGEVVGKEGEDLSRHDKWLCMMYPRLKLLHKLLADDGVIFISIDEIEHRYLELIMDELFGANNRIDTFVWQNNYGGGAKSNFVVHLHEYVLCFAKNIGTVGKLELPPDENILKYYKYKDEKFDVRGPYRLQPLATTSMDDRPNLRYPLYFEGHEIWPEKQWFWSKERALDAQASNDLVFSQRNGKWSVNYKQYLNGTDGAERKSKPYSIITGIYTQAGTKEIKNIMGNGKAFDFPKPPDLIKHFIQMVTASDDIILDSFAGSGTTAHAVLNMNKADGGNRKFILIEMMDYADSITAERVKRVISGYGEGQSAVEGTGGDFSFYELGEVMLHSDSNLNETLDTEKIRQYVYFTETRQPLAPSPEADNPYFLGLHSNAAYYFYYDKLKITTLDRAFLTTLGTKADRYIIYADLCTLSEKELTRFGITFKKIPRDIAKL